MTVQNSEYTKMSIHCHLGGQEADCKYDIPVAHTPIFNLEEAYRSIDEAKKAGFTLLAQTNSNNVDAASWQLSRKYARINGIELLPGAEINLQNWETEEILHVVVVLPPTANIFLFQQNLRSTCITNGKKFCHNRAVVRSPLCKSCCNFYSWYQTKE